MKIDCVSTKRLKTMTIGDSRIFTEPNNTKNSGSPSQSFAYRAGIQITTTTCFVVVPSTITTIKAVIVTRVA